MKAKKKSFRKEIRQPDEFQTFWEKVLETVLKNKREFLVGLVGLLVIVIAVFAGRDYFKNKEEKATNLLSQAQILLSTAPSPEDSIRIVFGVASSIFSRTSLRFKMISETSSLAPGMTLNSCSTVSNLTDTIAAP